MPPLCREENLKIELCFARMHVRLILIIVTASNPDFLNIAEHGA
jgi:hypothetical protein